MKYKPTWRGFFAVLIISIMFLAMGWMEAQPAHAVPSLQQQRIDRERSANRRHEIELAKIQAYADIEAAKYTRNYY